MGRVTPLGQSFLIDGHGIVLACDEATAKDLNTTSQELVGRCIFDLLPCEALEREKRISRQLKQTVKQLEEAMDKAKAADKAKSEFLTNMSHEIRTPMNGILGLTELLLRSAQTPQQRHYLGLIETSTKSLLTIINDLLDLSKIEQGKMSIEHVDFNLCEIVGQVIAEFAPQANEKGLELMCDLPADVPDTLGGDPGHLRQVLLNLIGNSIKFTKQGTITLCAKLQSRTTEEVCLHFAVTDTGIGIPKDKQRLIFEAFAQVNGSVSRKYGGTGLGLRISQELVELMGGRIGVESEPGKGSTFHFTVPFGLRSYPAVTICEDVLPVACPRRLSILLAEDDAINQVVTADMLKEEGHSLVVVNNGLEVLAALDKGSFDLILMDVQMPEMDGLEATNIIRQKETLLGTHIPIVGLTAHARQDDRQRCLDAGMDGYVAKPFTARTLLETVATIMHGRAPLDAELEVQVEALPPEIPETILDKHELFKRCGGNLQLLRNIIGIFFNQSPQMLSDIRSAANDGNLSALAEAAHKFKGATGTLCAKAACKTASILESIASTNADEAVEDAYNQLENEAGRLRDVLLQLTNELKV